MGTLVLGVGGNCISSAVSSVSCYVALKDIQQKSFDCKLVMCQSGSEDVVLVLGEQYWYEPVVL